MHIAAIEKLIQPQEPLRVARVGHAVVAGEGRREVVAVLHVETALRHRILDGNLATVPRRGRRVAQIDELEHLVVEERRCLRIAVAVVAAALGEVGDQLPGEPVEVVARVFVREVDEQHARPQDAQAVVIRREPGIAVGPARRVRPDGRVVCIGPGAGRLLHAPWRGNLRRPELARATNPDALLDGRAVGRLRALDSQRLLDVGPRGRRVRLQVACPDPAG